MKEELKRIATEVKAMQDKESLERRKQREEEERLAIEQMADAFLEEATKDLERKLLVEAQKGRFELLIFHSTPMLKDLETLQHKGLMRGLRKVAAWLKERDIASEIEDSGYSDDGGYYHTTRLFARWD